MSYWKPFHDQAIKEFISANCIATKNRLFDKILHKPFYELAMRAQSSLGLHPRPELAQDVVIHLYYKAMPKITEDKLQSALQFLWTSARNYIITYELTSANNPYLDRNTMPTSQTAEEPNEANIHSAELFIFEKCPNKEKPQPCEEPRDLDADYERDQVRKKAIAEIDSRLKGQHILNTTNSVFLLLLKQYILDNDYDVRGFGPYIMEAMHLKLATYRAISGRLGLRTKDFNEKLPK